MSMKRRLERLEVEDRADKVPWWTRPPGTEPDWPRPLADLSYDELEWLLERAIDVYCVGQEEGFGWHSTPQETFINQEAFHERGFLCHGTVTIGWRGLQLTHI